MNAQEWLQDNSIGYTYSTVRLNGAGDYTPVAVNGAVHYFDTRTQHITVRFWQTVSGERRELEYTFHAGGLWNREPVTEALDQIYDIIDAVEIAAGDAQAFEYNYLDDEEDSHKTYTLWCTECERFKAFFTVEQYTEIAEELIGFEAD